MRKNLVYARRLMGVLYNLMFFKSFCWGVGGGWRMEGGGWRVEEKKDELQIQYT